MKKKLIVLLAVLSMIAAPVACFAENIDNMTLEELREAYKELLAENEALKAKLGESKPVESELSQDGNIFRLTALETEEVTSLNYYGDILTPEEGNTFLLVQMEATNISSEDSYFNSLNFDSYLDGRSIETTVDYFDGYDPIVGDIRAGKIRDGYAMFEVPNDWKELEINYKEDYDTASITLVVTPDSFE